MKVTVQIQRKSVMGIVEGISVTISMHNGGTPTFEQLWASDAEGPKLDIYYREAISDLERHLIEYIATSSAQFDLQANGEDYVAVLDLSEHWPTQLKGLLANKVQDYLVHSVTAGWINDFDGLTVKQDYQDMAANDLTDIRSIVQMRDFKRAEAARATDEEKDESEYSASAGARQTDTDKAEEERLQTAGARQADTEKQESEYTATASERTEDSEKERNEQAMSAESRKGDETKVTTPDSQKASTRTSDKAKTTTADVQHASTRTMDGQKAGNPGLQTADHRHDTRDSEKENVEASDTGARHEDNAEVRHWRDDVDWSDTRWRLPHKVRII